MYYALFLLQLILIFFTSRFVMQKLFHLIKRMIRSTSVSFYIISLLYLPGTILHELSHLLTSIILFVMPHTFDLIPKVTEVEEGKYQVLMGSVHHAQTDPLRSMLIGSAPIVFGLLFFYGVFEFDLFPQPTLLMNLLMLYLFISVSSSMFSSKQDMRESLILLPIAMIVISVCIGFNVPVLEYAQSPRALDLMEKMNLYVASATGLNLLASLVLRKA